jgi:hypothetical protein
MMVENSAAARDGTSLSVIVREALGGMRTCSLPIRPPAARNRRATPALSTGSGFASVNVETKNGSVAPSATYLRIVPRGWDRAASSSAFVGPSASGSAAASSSFGSSPIASSHAVGMPSASMSAPRSSRTKKASLRPRKDGCTALAVGRSGLSVVPAIQTSPAPDTAIPAAASSSCPPTACDADRVRPSALNA